MAIHINFSVVSLAYGPPFQGTHRNRIYQKNKGMVIIGILIRLRRTTGCERDIKQRYKITEGKDPEEHAKRAYDKHTKTTSEGKKQTTKKSISVNRCQSTNSESMLESGKWSVIVRMHTQTDTKNNDLHRHPPTSGHGRSSGPLLSRPFHRRLKKRKTMTVRQV